MKKTSSIFCAVLCLAFLAWNIYAEHYKKFVISPFLKILMAFIFVILVTFSIKPSHGKIRKKIWIWALFLYYVWVLLNLLFFDVGMGRDEAMSGMNLVPFYTIKSYLLAYERGNIAAGHVVLNLFGNIAAFAPMAIFLPAIFKSQHNILIFFLTIFLVVSAIEGVQYATHTGSCDIDDLILNVCGAMAVWIILLPYRLIMKYKEKKER